MKKAIDFLKKTIEKNRLVHLYLICGSKGAGKKRLADEVAYLIVNQGKKEDDNLKKQIVDNTAINVYKIAPDGLSIKKQAIIDLQEEFSKTSLVDGPRVYIIDQVEKMSTSAANSLLKFMEEPISKQVYGFLLAEDKDAVIRTISSRSQVIQLNTRDEEELKIELINEGVNDEMATILPFLTKSVREIMEMVDNPNYELLIGFLRDYINVWLNRSELIFSFFVENGRFLISSKDFYNDFLEILLLYYVDLINYKTHQKIVFEFLREEIMQMSSQLTSADISYVVGKIKETIKMVNAYVNLELSIDNLANQLEKGR